MQVKSTIELEFEDEETNALRIVEDEILALLIDDEEPLEKEADAVMQTILKRGDTFTILQDAYTKFGAIAVLNEIKEFLGELRRLNYQFI